MVNDDILVVNGCFFVVDSLGLNGTLEVDGSSVLLVISLVVLGSLLFMVDSFPVVVVTSTVVVGFGFVGCGVAVGICAVVGGFVVGISRNYNFV